MYYIILNSIFIFTSFICISNILQYNTYLAKTNKYIKYIQYVA